MSSSPMGGAPPTVPHAAESAGHSAARLSDLRGSRSEPRDAASVGEARRTGSDARTTHALVEPGEDPLHFWDEDTVTPEGRVIAYCGLDVTAAPETDQGTPCALCAWAEQQPDLIAYDRRNIP